MKNVDMNVVNARLTSCYGDWKGDKLCQKCLLRAGCLDEIMDSTENEL